MHQFESFSLKIASYNTKYDYVLYKIVIKDKLVQKNWSFEVRFSQLKRLHYELFKHSNLKCPFPKNTFLRSKEKKFLEERLAALQKYFDTLLMEHEFKDILDNPVFSNFLYTHIKRSINANAEKEMRNF